MAWGVAAASGVRRVPGAGGGRGGAGGCRERVAGEAEPAGAGSGWRARRVPGAGGGRGGAGGCRERVAGEAGAGSGWRARRSRRAGGPAGRIDARLVHRPRCTAIRRAARDKPGSAPKFGANGGWSVRSVPDLPGAGGFVTVCMVARGSAVGRGAPGRPGASRRRAHRCFIARRSATGDVTDDPATRRPGRWDAVTPRPKSGGEVHSGPVPAPGTRARCWRAAGSGGRLSSDGCSGPIIGMSPRGRRPRGVTGHDPRVGGRRCDRLPCMRLVADLRAGPGVGHAVCVAGGWWAVGGPARCRVPAGQ